MNDFEILIHQVLADLTDVCNYVLHDFTFNRNCKGYLLDGVFTAIDNSSLQIRYPRGQEFKIEFYNDIVSGNVLTLTLDSVGGNSVFGIANVSGSSTVSLRFYFDSIIRGQGTVNYINGTTDPVMNVGDFIDADVNVDSTSNTYDYFQGFPFNVVATIPDPTFNDFAVRVGVIVLSSTLDQVPNPDFIEIQKNS